MKNITTNNIQTVTIGIIKVTKIILKENLKRREPEDGKIYTDRQHDEIYKNQLG